LFSVIILYNIKETLPDPQKFSMRFMKINRTEVFERSSTKPAVIMLLVCFSIGSVLTLSPDLSDSIGLRNKGFFLAVYTVASLVIRLIAGKSSDKYGRVIVLIWTSAVQTIAFIFLAFAHTVPMVIISAVIFGLGMGMNGPTLMAWAVDLCSAANRGKAVASVYIALEIGIGSGAIFSAWIYNNHLPNLKYAFLLTAALSLLAMFLLIAWRRKERRKAAADTAILEFTE
jgi:MFS family permease